MPWRPKLNARPNPIQTNQQKFERKLANVDSNKNQNKTFRFWFYHCIFAWQCTGLVIYDFSDSHENEGAATPPCKNKRKKSKSKANPKSKPRSNPRGIRGWIRWRPKFNARSIPLQTSNCKFKRNLANVNWKTKTHKKHFAFNFVPLFCMAVYWIGNIWFQWLSLEWRRCYSPVQKQRDRSKSKWNPKVEAEVEPKVESEFECDGIRKWMRGRIQVKLIKRNSNEN